MLSTAPRAAQYSSLLKLLLGSLVALEQFSKPDVYFTYTKISYS